MHFIFYLLFCQLLFYFLKKHINFFLFCTHHLLVMMINILHDVIKIMGFQILIVKALVAFYATTLGSGRTIDAKVCMHDIPHIVIIQINPPITGCRGDRNHIRNEITGKPNASQIFSMLLSVSGRSLNLFTFCCFLSSLLGFFQ